MRIKFCILPLLFIFFVGDVSRASEKNLSKSSIKKSFHGAFLIKSGKYDRKNPLVRVEVNLPKSFVKENKTVLVDSGQRILENGKKINLIHIAQVVKPSLLSDFQIINDDKLGVYELWIKLPGEIKANIEFSNFIRITKMPPPKIELKTFSWHDTKGKHLQLRYNDKPVLQYMYEKLDTSSKKRIGETYKVYHHVYSPDGKRLLTKGPGGLFPHHRGLFYGFNRISYGKNQKADIWHCKNGEHQAHVKVISSETGPLLGRHVVQVDWIGRDGKPFARELREMTAFHTAKGTMIEFASKLTSLVENLKLDGDPQHAGFQFRATQHVPDKTAKQTYYVRPDGKGKPGSFRNWPGQKDHINLPFNALCMVVDKQRYTVAYLDHPKNPKPARFSERNYGRFGSYFATTIAKGKSLDLNYRVWVQKGEMTVTEIETLSHDFVDPVTVKVKKLDK